MNLHSVPHDILPADEKLLNLPEVAELLDVPVTRVNDLLNAGKLLAVVRDGVRHVPLSFFIKKPGQTTVNKFLSGTITVLHDGGYDPEDILRYLYTEDETLPGRPIDGLQGHLAREVVRRAQGMGV
ncbi:DNA-binding protein [Corynebacterium occultum]|uniref:DNA-binding protein n=1 Tax=Corynebacterium occultum TaxID=2675219 RepID=A0A6B8W5H9_9CORY|nr:Rv2175c family DNA-binding protein [Corynebacterium occultum]QGU07821.1 DNA-binding protein [Corynebacterium occultum]